MTLNPLKLLGAWLDAREERRLAAKRRVLGEPEPHPQAGAFISKRTWVQRIVQKFFPKEYIPVGDYAFGVTSCVDMHFDWKDRLRLLVSGHVYCEVRVETRQHVDVENTVVVLFVEEPSTISGGVLTFEKDQP